jgi:hypothetical protein
MFRILYISINLIFLITIVSCISKEQEPLTEQSKPYFINPVTGNDSSNGLTEDTPWKSFKNIRIQAFNPGDQILLAEASVFNEALILKDLKGSAEAYIQIGTYKPKGSQGTKKSSIDVKDKPEAVLVQNCSYLTIRNLIVSANTLNGTENTENIKMRCGIRVTPDKDLSMQNIILEDLEIKDVFFDKPGTIRPDKEVQTSNGLQKYGWGIRFINHENTAVIKSVTIRNCKVENIGHTGIKFTGRDENIQNIIIEGCNVYETGGPGIQMSGVETGHVFNSMINKSGNKNDSRKWGRGSGLWTWGSSNILIEKNHFLNAGGPGDSAGCHIDFNCKNIVVQYNFSANNAGGFCEILGNNYNCSYRYNISVNDGYRVKGKNGAFQEGKLLWLSGYAGKKNKRKGPFNSYIYNNTIFVNNSIISNFAFDKAASGVLIMNNIFCIEGKSKGVLGDQYRPEEDGSFNIKNIVFQNNLFLESTNWPSEIPMKDKSPLFGTPEFINKGGINITDYIPENKKLIKDKGIQIQRIPNDQIGLSMGLKVKYDILGNLIDKNPDIGAIEMK